MAPGRIRRNNRNQFLDCRPQLLRQSDYPQAPMIHRDPVTAIPTSHSPPNVVMAKSPVLVKNHTIDTYAT